MTMLSITHHFLQYTPLYSIATSPITKQHFQVPIQYTLAKKKLNEPRECLFKGLQSKVLVEK